MNALGVLPFPLDRMFVHCRFPSFHSSPGLTASPLQVTLLPHHPQEVLTPLGTAIFYFMFSSIINKREDLSLSLLQYTQGEMEEKENNENVSTKGCLICCISTVLFRCFHVSRSYCKCISQAYTCVNLRLMFAHLKTLK